VHTNLFYFILPGVEAAVDPTNISELVVVFSLIAEAALILLF
jgi:hypothetical protein